MATESSERLDQRRLTERLEMLDQRLDNMDSVITTLVERVMRQPLTLHVTCPSCGKAIEISLTGTVRAGKGGA
ncbi:MAG: hypothetical protein HYX87_09380 [Chloroflexi bacterium]|nr:hypothetical protein [Chloroflexota bacterium]